jgi:hypothetical protein
MNNKGGRLRKNWQLKREECRGRDVTSYVAERNPGLGDISFKDAGDGKRQRRTKRGTYAEKANAQFGGFFRRERMVHGGGYRRIGMGK